MSEKEKDKCTICLTEISKYELFLTSCMHRFHYHCIHKLYYSTDDATCPQCRYPIEGDELEELEEKIKNKYLHYGEMAQKLANEITCILSDSDGDYNHLYNLDIMKILYDKSIKLKDSLGKALKWYPLKENLEINISDDE